MIDKPGPVLEVHARLELRVLAVPERCLVARAVARGRVRVEASPADFACIAQGQFGVLPVCVVEKRQRLLGTLAKKVPLLI
ncbi:hypothetical protein GCM10017744_000560 [Streptomyces antimycoticus]